VHYVRVKWFKMGWIKVNTDGASLWNSRRVGRGNLLLEFQDMFRTEGDGRREE
jgi:hypothetical protein